MSTTKSIDSFTSFVSSWLQEERTSRIQTYFEDIFIRGKEQLHGVQFPPGSRAQIRQCLIKPEKIAALFKNTQQDPDKSPNAVEGHLEDWMVKTTQDCATELARKLPVNPEAHPIPLSASTLPKFLETDRAIVEVFKDNCFPCHFNAAKLKCAADKLYPTHPLYTIPLDRAKTLLPDLSKQVQGTPELYEHNSHNGTYTCLDSAKIWKIIEEHCSK